MTDGPYKLPSGWRWVRLGDICLVIETGFAFRKKGVSNGDLLHLRPYNIGEDGTLDFSQRFLVPSDLCPTRRRILQPGDVLFNNTNSVELVGKTALVTQPVEAAFSNHITLLRTRPEQAEGAWVALALRAMWHQGFFAERCNKWIGQAGINTATLRTFVIPLPSLSEQRRIVAKVEALMERIREVCRLRADAKKDAERLMQAALAEVFPRPGQDLPTGWRWVRLGEVFVLRNGKFIRKSELDDTGTVRVYGSNGLLGYAQKALIEQDTIVIGRVGACGAVNWAAAPAWISDNAMYVSEWLIECDRRYILIALGFRDLPLLAKQGAQPSISQQDVYETTIPLPPLSEQRRIVAYLDQIQQQVTVLKHVQAESEAELKRLEQAILDKVFRGEL